MHSTSHRRPRIALGLFLVWWPVSAAALEFEFDLEDHGHNPAIDPDGSLLLGLFNVAASYWERQIDGGTIHHVDIWWEPLDDGALGRWEPTINPFGDNDLKINPNIAWFLDLTPFEHEEFTFTTPVPPDPADQGQSLYRDLTTSQQNDWFNGDAPPDVLEVGYRGNALAGSAAFGLNDVLSTMIHELGHELGINSTDIFDDDFRVVGVPGEVYAAYDDGHLAVPYSAMCGSCADSNLRWLPSALDVLTVAYEEAVRKALMGLPGVVQPDLDRKHFYHGNDWNAPVGWIGSKVPDASNEVAVLDDRFAMLSANGIAGTLTVAEGSNVTTSNHHLNITNRTLITGMGSTMRAEFGGEIQSPLVEVESSATLSLLNGGVLDVGVLKIASGTELQGLSGTHTVDVDTLFENNGTIAVSSGSTMQFTTTAIAPWDLDGTSESGVLDASDGSMNFFSGSLTDQFSGEMKIGAGRFISIANPLILDQSALINMSGGGDFASRARLAGGLFVMSSFDSTLRAQGVAHIDVPTTIFDGSVLVSPAATLDFNQHASLEGGSFTIYQGGNLNFNSTVSFEGNVSLSTFSTSTANDIELNGATTYGGGTITIQGIVRQDGNASTSAATTINSTGVFDMDGSNPAPTSWSINKALTINSAYVEVISLVPNVNPNNVVHSTISIVNAGSLAVNPNSGSLAINLANNAVWRMAGTLNLDGSTNAAFTFVPTMVSGSAMYLTGTMNIQDRVSISAPMELSGTTNINANSTLFVGGRSTIRSFAVVTGAGQMVNHADQLIIENGGHVGVPLTNHGGLEVGYPDLASTVSLTSLQQGPAGKIHMDLGGNIVGTGYDRLNVLGNLQLAGSLEVGFINGYVPAVGTIFDLFNWFSLAGAFESLVLPQIFGRAWNTSQLYVNGEISLSSTAQIPGDYNNDGTVNAADYTVWRDTAGSNQNLTADGNFSGSIDSGDYDLWVANFGTTIGSGSRHSNPVPEPTMFNWMALAGGLACAATVRRIKAK